MCVREWLHPRDGGAAASALKIIDDFKATLWALEGRCTYEEPELRSRPEPELSKSRTKGGNGIVMDTPTESCTRGAAGNHQELIEKIIVLPGLAILAPTRVYTLCLGTGSTALFTALDIRYILEIRESK
ncbi:hypothetical protein EVAR_39756_1 [Eumeta japonica]|uniref:Uncharacterized protein n=1 Tax=Eumeta variegata TaxID=151549 RepID=A0A4C1X4I3_EUMVA|nr:hypothetical protein EVAR_39756_1 [Eumeta japonica]